MATISLDLEDPAQFAQQLEHAGRGAGQATWEAFSTAAYQIQEQTSDDTEQANREHRRKVAVSVLEAIDVDQYLIDAVRNASPEPGPLLNTASIGCFAVIPEDLASLAGGVVPEWLKFDADAAIGALTEPAHLLPTPTPAENKVFEEGFDAACDELTGTLNRLLDQAITGERKDAYEKAIAAVAHQKAWT